MAFSSARQPSAKKRGAKMLLIMNSTTEDDDEYEKACMKPGDVTAPQAGGPTATNRLKTSYVLFL
jgi:hypothetical protein